MIEQEKRVDEMSLSEKVNLMAKHMNLDEARAKEKKKMKNFKFLPKKLSRSKLKKNFCILILIRTNGYLDIRKLPIEDGIVYLKDLDLRYSVTAAHIMRWRNLPIIIQPEWSLEPISPESLQRKALDDKMLAYPQKILVTHLKKGQVQAKRGMGNWLWWLIGGVVIIFLITQIAGIKLF